MKLKNTFQKRLYNTIKNKIWLQCNETDIRIAEELVKSGIMKEDIILANQHPEDWQYIDYGTDEDYVSEVTKGKVGFS